MSLIECPECKKMISENAKTCPECGYDFATKKGNAKSKNDEKAGKLLKAIFLTALALIVLVILLSIFNGSSTKGDGWEVISTSEYVRNNKKCMGYRVYLSESKTSEEKQKIFEEITNHSSYYLHTVWFYSTKSGASGSGSYDMGMMEQTYKGEKPIVQ